MRTSLSPTALRNIQEIGEHLKGTNPRAAADFGNAVTELMTRLSDFPDSGRRTSRAETRLAMLRSFPYHVFYRRLSRDEVRIMRIRHAHRRPLP